MVPLLAFVAVDLFAKQTGKFQTTSRLLRENRVAAGLLVAWCVYHIYVEDYDYGPKG